MTSDQTEKDPMLEIFLELYANAMTRNNPWLAIEMDGKFYDLGKLYNLLERESIDDMIKHIMESWTNWLGSYKIGKEEKIKLETMSFEEPTFDAVL